MANNKGTKRPNGDGYIGQRADGWWVAIITIPNGKPKHFHGTTQREALDKKQAALRDQDNGIDLSQKKLTVGAFLDRWLEDVAKPKVRPKTYRFYEQVVRVHLKPELGRHHLGKLTRPTSSAFSTRRRLPASARRPAATCAPCCGPRSTKPSVGTSSSAASPPSPARPGSIAHRSNL